MPELTFGTSVQDRDEGNFPDLPVINMVTEQVATEGGLVLQSRPGLEQASAMGNGPINQLFHKDGIINSSLFGISGGTNFYQSASLVGSIDGNGFVSMDGYQNLLFITAGTSLWSYDGTTLGTVTFPVGTPLHLVVGADRLIVIEKDTGIVYWSDPLVSTIGALSFNTAEASPDKLKHLLFIGDTLTLFGAETVEFWTNSTDATLPFQPVVGRTYSVGIRDTGCATEFNGSFAWITNRNQVCFSDPGQVLSNPSLDEKLTNSVTANLWTFDLNGIEFLAVTLDDQTWVLSAKTQTWSTFESYGETNWIPTSFAGGFFGSSLDGRILRWSDDHSDFDTVLERRFRAGSAIDSSVVPIGNITIRTNPGQTPYEVGNYTNPVVGMRVSRDGGFTWTRYYERKLGAQGKYRNFSNWRSLGYCGRPGLLVEFRVTDPVPFRVSKVSLNEDYGGV